MESTFDTVCFCLSRCIRLSSTCPYPYPRCTVTAPLLTAWYQYQTHTLEGSTYMFVYYSPYLGDISLSTLFYALSSHTEPLNIVQLPSTCPYSHTVEQWHLLQWLGINIELVLQTSRRICLYIIHHISVTFHRRNPVLRFIVSYRTTEHACFCKISIDYVACLYDVSSQFD